MPSRYGLLMFALYVCTLALIIMGRWDLALMLWGITIPALLFGHVLAVLACIGAGIVLGLSVNVLAWAVWWLLGGLSVAFVVLMVAGRVMLQQAKEDVK